MTFRILLSTPKARVQNDHHAMRFHGIVLPVLAVAVLNLSADGRPTDIAKMETPNMPAMAHSFTGAQYAQRMLRTVDDDEDERGLTDKLSGILENVATKSELKSLLKKGTSTDDMLDKLKLNTGVVNILENPTFKRLDDYVAMYKDAFPHSGVTMVGTLTARYGDDAVARALEAGKKSIATEEMAKKLQGEQFRLWLDGGKDPVQVFRLLKLNDKTTRPLTGDTLGAWRSYLALFNNRKAETPFDELTVFRKVYGDRGFANLLLTACRGEENLYLCYSLTIKACTCIFFRHCLLDVATVGVVLGGLMPRFWGA